MSKEGEPVYITKPRMGKEILDLLRNNLEKPGEWIPIKRSNMRGAMDALEGSIS